MMMTMTKIRIRQLPCILFNYSCLCLVSHLYIKHDDVDTPHINNYNYNDCQENDNLQGVFFLLAPHLKVLSTDKLILARLGVSRTIYANVDSLFRGAPLTKKHHVCIREFIFTDFQAKSNTMMMHL